eukprot:TRINITY_DN7625_c2_g1_i1.p1 TRINITY_DN7625_c2_g1~~TRINITY_DN7625_c2_g1_i1.p1  ORF type:complete len:219 (-),score=59.26 TRINITY_DN7625_c2_g1_i1:103-759(-)
MADFTAKLGKLRGYSLNKQDTNNVTQRNAVMDFEMDNKLKSKSLPNHYAKKQTSFATNGRALQVVESRSDKKKLLYKLSVEWSDGTASHAYRSYTDFFNLQCKLLNTFPEEAGKRKSARTIPFLPGRQIFARSTRALAEQRLPEIDKYLIELLKLPELLSRHQYVCEFLRNDWEEDLHQVRGSPTKKAKFYAFDEDTIQSNPLIMESVDSIASSDAFV